MWLLFHWMVKLGLGRSLQHEDQAIHRVSTPITLYSLVVHTFTSDLPTTPCSVRLTCSFCYTNRSITNITALCNHSSSQSGSGIWTVADHYIGRHSEVRAGGWGKVILWVIQTVIPYQHLCPYLYSLGHFQSMIHQRNMSSLSSQLVHTQG